MSVFRGIGVAVIMGLAMACSSDTIVGPAGRFNHAAATFACGPADGPAVAFYFASEPVTKLEPTGDYVRVYVARTLEEVAAGKIWPVSSSSEAGAWYHRANGDYEIATSGFLRITSVSADKTVVGSVSLTFPDAGLVHGEFQADWLDMIIGCF